MRFARRAAGLAESATMRVSRRAQELRAAGREIIDFGAGEPDFPSPAAAIAAAHRGLDEGFTRYTAAAGTPELRRALAERFAREHGTPWEVPNTLITVGAKGALFELVLVLVDDGDEVVLHTPTWVSFEAQIRFAGGRPVGVATDLDDGFEIRAEPLLAALTDRTRLVLVNSPNNPTGGVISGAELRRLVEGCAARGVFVLCDETYERFVYDGHEAATVAALAREFPDTVLLVGSFSKTYSMTGWRIGYCLGPEPVIRQATALQSHATSNPTSFAMCGALAALRESEAEVGAMIAEFTRRRALVVERLGRLPGMRCRPPSGAFYAFPHVAGCFDAERGDSVALAEHLLDVAGVALVPGAAFGADDHLRLSFACSWEALETGLARIESALLVSA